jgi:hypothetical protein
MSDSGQAQPAAEQPDELPEADDPEILALLDFEPVPRKIAQPGAWTPELQRKFIARLAVHGSKYRACRELGKDRGGIVNLYNSPDGASFRAAWHAAMDLWKRREAEKAAKGPSPAGMPPTAERRRKQTAGDGPLPGQVLNEYDEYEDEESLRRRGEEARSSIGNKLIRIRRLFLQEISASPGKRAAFEILTELPIDWEIAERGEPQPDEPWKTTNQRQPDMILMAESGWTFGDHGYGPNKMDELRRAIDEHRAAEGLPPVDWEAD